MKKKIDCFNIVSVSQPRWIPTFQLEYTEQRHKRAN